MIRGWFWLVVDCGWFLLTAAATLLVCVSMIASPIWLGMIHHELTIIRDCAQKDVTVIDVHPDGPGPILPRVLPRLRRIGEEAAE